MSRNSLSGKFRNGATVSALKLLTLVLAGVVRD